MVHCYMCDKDVEKYKTNSHVIPRNLLIPLKVNGQFALIDNVEKVNRPAQREIIGNFICEECENGTKYDDAFAKQFFIDYNKKYILISKVNKIVLKSNHNWIRAYLELYPNIHYFKFKKFILSIILRQYCYDKVINKKEIFLNNHLIKIR